MKKVVIILAIVASLTACNKTKTAEATTTTEATTESHEHKDVETNNEKLAYVCPMDCEKGKTYDQSGKCPKCEMDLEKK